MKMNDMNGIKFDKFDLTTLANGFYRKLCTFENDEWTCLKNSMSEDFEKYNEMTRAGRSSYCFEHEQDYRNMYYIWCGLEKLLKEENEKS